MSSAKCAVGFHEMQVAHVFLESSDLTAEYIEDYQKLQQSFHITQSYGLNNGMSTNFLYPRIL